MRLFIAIELPEDVKDQIQAFARRLADQFPDPARALRWVHRDQYHLTLKFLGECSEEMPALLRNSLDLAAPTHKAFDLVFRGIGSFTGGKWVKVIWLDTEEGAEATSQLANSIERACEPLGFPKEDRSFHPHLTLARSKRPFPEFPLRETLQKPTCPAIGPVHVEKFSVIQSVLSPRGPSYTTLQEVLLSPQVPSVPKT